VYCWFHPKVGLWLGATPETLLQVSNKRFKTMSLAGTKNFEGTLKVNWSSKEINEQKIVTDFIIEKLQTEISDLQVSDTETIKAGSLLHLRAIVSGRLNQKNQLHNILEKLHPTPAVCGYPTKEAKQFILANERYHREFYTGFLGEFNFKERRTRNSNKRNVENNAYTSVKTVTNLFVNLRCMQLKEKKALIYIGGGITSDSIPENEWQETVYKSDTIKKAL
jgi:isochorismate synthase